MRHGFLLLDFLIGLAVLSLLAAGAVPAIAAISAYAAAMETRAKVQEDAVFAADYITDRIRYCLDRTQPQKEPIYTAVYSYQDYDENENPNFYWIIAEKKRWFIKLYTGRQQPITGDSNDGTDLKYTLVQFKNGGKVLPYFTIYPHGLVRISYQIERVIPSASYELTTSILPLRDYFLVGDFYE